MNSLILTIQNSSNVDSISLMAVIIVFIAFIIGWVVNRITLLRIRKNSMQVKDLSTIMQHTLNTSNNYVLKLSMQERYGRNMHGNFLPEEGMSYDESLEYIHPEDRHLYVEYQGAQGRVALDARHRYRRICQSCPEDTNQLLLYTDRRNGTYPPRATGTEDD